MSILRRCLVCWTVSLASCSAVRSHTPPPPTAQPPASGGPRQSVYAHIGPDQLLPITAAFPARVYVPNTISNTVDVIDPATRRIQSTFPTGRTPQHVTPSWDLSRLYVDNDASNTLTVIDPKTATPIGTIRVDDPYNLYFTPDGTLGIVVAERRRRLDFVDPVTFKLRGSLPIPHAGPNHLDFSPDGRFLLLSCEFSGFVVKVDVTKRRVVGELRVGGKPADVRLGPDGNLFFVANEQRGGVSVIDARRLREVEFVPTGPGAHGFVVSRDGTKLYVTNRRGGTISVLDFATHRVVETWNTGGSPDMGGVSADGKTLWLSSRYDGTVLVVDTATGKVQDLIRVGRGPHGVSVFPQPGRFSLGHTGNTR